MSLADVPIIRIVGGGDLEKSGGELGHRIVRVAGHHDVLVGDDGDKTIHDRQAHLLADEVYSARVLGIHGHGGVAEHGLGARGGDGYVFDADAAR